MVNFDELFTFPSLLLSQITKSALHVFLTMKHDIYAVQQIM